MEEAIQFRLLDPAAGLEHPRWWYQLRKIRDCMKYWLAYTKVFPRDLGGYLVLFLDWLLIKEATARPMTDVRLHRNSVRPI